MAVLMVMSEPETYDVVSGPVSDISAPNTYPTRGSRQTIKIDNGGHIKQTFSAVDEVWVHFNFYPNQAENVYLINNLSGKKLLKIKGDNTTPVIDFFWSPDGVTFNLLCSLTSIFNAYRVIDFHFKIGAAGLLEVFYDGVKSRHVTGAFITNDSTFDRIDFECLSSNSMYINQIIVADTSTVGLSMQTVVPTGAGAGASWPSGTYSDVNETGAVNFSNYIEATAAGQIDSFITEDVTALSGTKLVVKGVSLAASAESDVNIPAIELRFGVYQYDPNTSTSFNQTGNLLPSIEGLGPVTVQEYWPVDALNLEWTETSFNDIEIAFTTGIYTGPYIVRT